MLLIEVLKSYDSDNLEKIVEEFSHSNNTVDLTGHLRQWAVAKQSIFEKLGNKLKIEQEVEFAVSSSELSNRIRTFIKTEFWGKKKFFMAQALFENLSDEEIAFNKIILKRPIFQQNVNVGMKVSKLLSKIVPKEDVDYIQTKFSMLIQNFKVKGKAVISIDPVDYLTMSENSSGWTSCHRINGEYRSGILAYLVDNVTAIAYVTTGENSAASSDKKIFFENKNWRQCVYFGETSAVQSRQYPSNSDVNNNTISEMLKNLFGKGYIIQTTTARNIRDNKYVVDNGGRYWYNDIVCGWDGKVQIIIKEQSPMAVLDTSYYCDTTSREGESPFEKIAVGPEDGNVHCACGCKRSISSSSSLYADFCYSEEEEYDDEDDYDYEEDYEDE